MRKTTRTPRKLDDRVRRTFANKLRMWMEPNPLAAGLHRHFEAKVRSGEASPEEVAALEFWRRGSDQGHADALAAAVDGDWPRLFMWITRAYRLAALKWCAPYMTDRDYWINLGDLWSDAECLWQYGHLLTKLLNAPRPGREAMMDETERAALAALPEQFEIYRGAQRGLNERGWSWTLDEDVALWFTVQYGGKAWEGLWTANRVSEPVLMRARVLRHDVVAYFSGRKEKEIVVAPESLSDVLISGLDDGQRRRAKEFGDRRHAEEMAALHAKAANARPSTPE